MQNYQTLKSMEIINYYFIFLCENRSNGKTYSPFIMTNVIFQYKILSLSYYIIDSPLDLFKIGLDVGVKYLHQIRVIIFQSKGLDQGCQNSIEITGNIWYPPLNR